MAMKVKLMKLLQEVRGLAEITGRRPLPKPSVLYLMQLRWQAAAANMTRRKLVINVDHQEAADIPHPVKIIHRKPIQPGLLFPAP
jgi:hypothetical protein